jgi:hypothetical protein
LSPDPLQSSAGSSLGTARPDCRFIIDSLAFVLFRTGFFLNLPGFSGAICLSLPSNSYLAASSRRVRLDFGQICGWF